MSSFLGIGGNFQGYDCEAWKVVFESTRRASGIANDAPAVPGRVGQVGQEDQARLCEMRTRDETSAKFPEMQSHVQGL